MASLMDPAQAEVLRQAHELRGRIHHQGLDHRDDRLRPVGANSRRIPEAAALLGTERGQVRVEPGDKGWAIQVHPVRHRGQSLLDIRRQRCPTRQKVPGVRVELERPGCAQLQHVQHRQAVLGRRGGVADIEGRIEHMALLLHPVHPRGGGVQMLIDAAGQPRVPDRCLLGGQGRRRQQHAGNRSGADPHPHAAQQAVDLRLAGIRLVAHI